MFLYVSNSVWFSPFVFIIGASLGDDSGLIMTWAKACLMSFSQNGLRWGLPVVMRIPEVMQ
jgi:hypothetical protein